MKLKYFTRSIICIDVLLIIYIAFRVIVYFYNSDVSLSYNFSDAGSIGIIGGADGPIAESSTNKFSIRYYIGFILVIVLNTLMIILNRLKSSKKK